MTNARRRKPSEVGKETAQDRSVTDDEQIALLALELENAGLEPDGEVVVALAARVAVLVRLFLRALVLVWVRLLDLGRRHAVCHRQTSFEPRRAPITPGLISLICESSLTR